MGPLHMQRVGGALLLLLLVGGGGARFKPPTEKELIDLLSNKEAEEDSVETTVVERDKYAELESAIPGLKDGKFKSPSDGRWKKVKSISKIKKKVNNDVTKPKHVKNVKPIKTMKRIKGIMPIDEDLALEMKHEVEAGTIDDDTSPQIGNLDVKEVNADSNSDLQAKVDRVLKMFNAKSLDDIIKVQPIKSMHKIESGGIYPENVSTDQEKREEINYIENQKPQGGLALDLENENRNVKELEEDLQKNVEKLAEDSNLLEREKSVQSVLENMLAV